MRPRLACAVAALVLGAGVAAAGCGFGEGEKSEGEATLTVTRDYGSEPMHEVTIADPTEADTVIRVLDREAEITTRYGGGFVQSIDGLEGKIAGDRSLDWFFFVNGIESDRGSADVAVRAGDRIWWDYRDWTDALRTPVVLGSWPEPFAQEAEGDAANPVKVECDGGREACELVAERLADAGAEATIVDGDARPDRKAMRVLVGPWSELRDDGLAANLAEHPQMSGVFARFAGDDDPELLALNERAQPAARLGPGAGLVAGMRRGVDPPTLVVTGTDPEGVRAAVELLDEDSLANHYAVAVADGEELALPVVEAESP